MNTALSLVCFTALANSVSAAPDVLVVDALAGPGSDFAEIQPAVDAAVDGDVILVRAGVYAAFDVPAKDLQVVADNDQTVEVNGQINVSGTTVSDTVVLRGLRTGSAENHGLEIVDCAGAVWIEECVLEAQQTTTEYETAVQHHGAVVRNSANVAFTRSTLFGGPGNNVGFFGQPYPGGHALNAEDSTVSIVGCTLRGGVGASAPPYDTYSGAFGGSGIRIANARLWISESHAIGGHGGTANDDYSILFGKTCGSGGDGGDGLQISSFHEVFGGLQALPSSVTYRDFSVQPGIGGDVTCGVPGETGVLVDADVASPHVVQELSGVGRQTYASSPARGGGVLRLHSSGAPGDFVFVAIGTSFGAQAGLPMQPLPLAVNGPYTVITVGALPASGKTITAVPLSPFQPGFGAVTLPMQGLRIDPSSQLGFELTPFGSLTLLEQTY